MKDLDKPTISTFSWIVYIRKQPHCIPCWEKAQLFFHKMHFLCVFSLHEIHNLLCNEDLYSLSLVLSSPFFIVIWEGKEWQLRAPALHLGGKWFALLAALFIYLFFCLIIIIKLSFILTVDRIMQHKMKNNKRRSSSAEIKEHNAFCQKLPQVHAA